MEHLSSPHNTVRSHRVHVRAGFGVNGSLAHRLYDIEGAEHTVLLLHGLGSSGLDWSMQIAALTRRYRVLTMDFPGHGESQPVSRGITIRALSRSVFRTLEETGAEPDVIVGHSLGGLAALQMAVDAPDRFKALVLVNAVPHVSVSRHTARQALGRVPDVVLNRMHSLAEFVASEHFPRPDQAVLRRLAVRRIRSADRGTYLHLISAIARFDVRARLHRISMPVLVVSGSEDRVFSIRDKRVLVDRLSRPEWVEMQGSGHASPQDAPYRFNSHLCSFLDRVFECELQATSA